MTFGCRVLIAAIAAVCEGFPTIAMCPHSFFASAARVCDNRSMNDFVKQVENARVYDVAIESPLELAPNLSARLGNRVLLKREDLQSVFSFKLRGAYNKLAALSDAEAANGVICSSAGNHAQGVALAASNAGCAPSSSCP